MGKLTMCKWYWSVLDYFSIGSALSAGYAPLLSTLEYTIRNVILPDLPQKELNLLRVKALHEFLTRHVLHALSSYSPDSGR